MADYPLPVFLAVLGSAVLHAAWNAVIRSGADRMLHTGAIVFWTGVIALPVLWFVAPPAPESWGFLAISNVVHMLYYVALASAYRTGNLSFAYPLIRGMAPLMIALGGLLVFGEALRPLGWAGILLVCAGVLLIAFRSRASGTRATVLWSLLCAATIAVYSLSDGRGVRVSGSVAGYGAWMYVLEAIIFGAGLTLAGRGRELATYIAGNWRSTLLGGAMSATAYGISLWAMARAPVALVSATRETSVLFAAMIGVLLLHERFTRRQWLGAGAVVLGTLVLRG